MTKIGMRRAWFQVHKWIGLILAVLIIPLSLTGAALVWDEAFDHMLNPARYATSGSATIDPQLYIAAAQGALAQGDTISGITLPDGDGPVVVQATMRGPSISGPARKSVYLDPPSARVLDVADNRHGALRVMHMIHGSLMLPGWGRTIVGWLGVAMLVSSVSGIWLWWPTVGKWVRGLRWRRHRNLDTNLHHLMGFWIALPLFVLSLTGAWISFPKVFGLFDGAKPAGPDRATMARAAPLATPRLGIDTVIASAQAVAPGDIAQIGWPTDKKPVWQVKLEDGRAIAVADRDATVSVAPPPGRESWARLMRRVHDGTGMGLGWQLIIFIGGILPAVLAVTGIIMWWRARGWKSALEARQRAA